MGDEKTGKKVAAIAGKVLAMLSELPDGLIVGRNTPAGFTEVAGKRTQLWQQTDTRWTVTVRDLKALAASCLNQAPDRPKRDIRLDSPIVERKRAAKRKAAGK